MDTVSFEVSREDRDLCQRIADRACDLAAEQGVKLDRLSTFMDVVACHANGNPLRLADLLAADNFNLMHDVIGIGRHIDRETGQLLDFFSPRFSARAEAEAA